VKTAMLRVPGAEIFYKVRGRGPLLVMSAGGSGNADALDALAAGLENEFTVASYDRRGYSRSPLENPADASVIPVEVAADDLHRLLAALGTEPALVFGNSLGALIAVELLARHPEQVRRLVAHEPPAHQLVPESARPPLPDPRDPASLARYSAAIGVTLPALPPDLPPELLARKAADGKHFVTREAAPRRAPPAPPRRPRQVAPTKLVLVGGEEGRPYIAYRCAAALAAALGLALKEFPGNHSAPSLEPDRVLQPLRRLLAAG
jgi:pimeloyl-ACP methyl ester carboxylesterase